MSEILEKSVLEIIKENYDKIFSAEKKVVEVILKRPQDVVNMNVAELAKASGVSDATVVRMCHHIVLNLLLDLLNVTVLHFELATSELLRG